jgi:integrase
MNRDIRLSDALVRSLTAPHSGNRITYERGKGAITGFGVRITAASAKSFVLNYTLAGRERRYTIGTYPAWSVGAARDEAKRLRQDVDRGIDPLGAREAEREAATVNELGDRYLAEHAIRKRTGKDDESMLQRLVRPELGNQKVAAITFADIDRLHRKITQQARPYQANRMLALLSKMFSLSIRWEMRSDNPAKGVERNLEAKRHRYLTGDELRRLTEALAKHSSPIAANAIRLLLLTGARRGEVLSATWDQFDLEAAVWVKPSSHTKNKLRHRVPLSAPARQLLVQMRDEEAACAQQGGRSPSPYAFPGRKGDGPMVEIKKTWASLCKAAGIAGVRIHDLRHTYASVLASSGLSLPIIGALLGHTQPSTTARYAHLFDDPLRIATERAAAIISGANDGHEAAPVAPFRRR